MDSVMRFLIGSAPMDLDTDQKTRSREEKHSLKLRLRVNPRTSIGRPGRPILDLSFHAQSTRKQRS